MKSEEHYSEQRIVLINSHQPGIPEKVFSHTKLKELVINNYHDKYEHLKNLYFMVSSDPEVIQDSKNGVEAVRKATIKWEEIQSKINALPPVGLTVLSERIAELKTLEMLDLAHNQLVEIPNAIFELENLKVLKLNRNQLRLLPQKGWSRLAKLETVHLFGNRIESVPVELIEHSLLSKRKAERLEINKLKKELIDKGQYEAAANAREQEMQLGLFY